MTPLYLDNNATTMPAPEVVEAMLPFLRENYGNPSSIHRFGQLARHAIDEARARTAALIGCKDAQLVFTGSATESVNTAIRSLIASRSPRKKIIISNVEHSATRSLCQQLGKEGFEIVELKVNRLGQLDPSALAEKLSDEVALATFLWANNESGVLFPVEELSRICRERGVPFHTDATQVIGKLPVNVDPTCIDLMSFAAHKFHGPKGIGGLYVRRGHRLRPLIIGGPQERERRGGTENVPGIVGMGRAAQLAMENLPKMADVAKLRDRLEREILGTIPYTFVNGDVLRRIPNTTNISFARLEAEAILLLLSEKNVCASAGAACSSGSLEPSHVLKGMGIEANLARGAIRFSLSRYSTDAEIDEAMKILPPVIQRLRKVLPV